ncbi:hypothetical protein SO694_00054272 [Aureococcus anophagefferens]|uniref:Uncharacterized protein n=1 Tax=Aureococcus anophagefferens TaxID=44056 RepID=A0ABR1FXU0_AURAN
MSMIAASRTVARACLRTSSAAALSTATEGAALHKDAKLLVCDMAGTTVMEEGLVYSTLLDCMVEKGLGVAEAEMHPWHGADKTEVTANFVQREIAGGGARLAMVADIDALFLEALLEKLELKSMVDAWCCAADVTRARPSPFMVFNLMNQCNVETGVVKFKAILEGGVGVLKVVEDRRAGKVKKRPRILTLAGSGKGEHRDRPLR